MGRKCRLTRTEENNDHTRITHEIQYRSSFTDPIKHQDTELFAKIFNGIRPVNTFAKFSASGVWPEVH